VPPRILLADDNSSVRRSLGRQLEDRGAEVVLVGDGDEAWEWWSHERFDGVLSDWNMPKLDGVALLSRLLEAGPGRSAVLTLMTGDDPAHPSLGALRAKGVLVLAKPIEAQKLDELVRRSSSLRSRHGSSS